MTGRGGCQDRPTLSPSSAPSRPCGSSPISEEGGPPEASSFPFISPVRSGPRRRRGEDREETARAATGTARAWVFEGTPLRVILVEGLCCVFASSREAEDQGSHPVKSPLPLSTLLLVRRASGPV